MEQIRHGIAIGICLYAVVYAIEDKPLKYFFCCLFASLLHSSAILFIPLYVFRKVNLNIKKIVLLLVGSLVVSQINFMAILGWANVTFLHNARIQEKVMLYQGQTIEGIFSITFFLRIFVLFLYYIVVYRAHSNELKTKIMINGYFYGIIIFLVFNSISILAVRSSAIFRCFELIMVAEILSAANYKNILPLKWFSALREKGLVRCESRQSIVLYRIVDISTNMNYLTFFSVIVLFLYYFYKFGTLMLDPSYFNYFSI